MNWSKRNKIIYIILLLGFVGVLIGYNIIYKPHPRIEEQKAFYVGDANEFKTKITHHASEMESHGIVELSGTITALNNESLLINQDIYCQLKDISGLESLTANQPITIKGRFIGYDDLLEEIKIDKCIILSN